MASVGVALLIVAALGSWLSVWVEAVLLWRFSARYFAFGPKVDEQVASLDAEAPPVDLGPRLAGLGPGLAAKMVTPSTALVRAEGAGSWPHLPPLWSPHMTLSVSDAGGRQIIRLVCRHAIGWPAFLGWPVVAFALGMVVNRSITGLIVGWLAALLVAVPPIALSVRAARRSCRAAWQAVAQQWTA